MTALSRDQICEFIISKVHHLTKGKYTEITPHTHLATVGVDSLFAVLICGFIEDEYAIEVEPVLMFEYKTAAQVADAVLVMIGEQREWVSIILAYLRLDTIRLSR